MNKLDRLFDRSRYLSINYRWYRQQLKYYLLQAIQQDASKDITSKQLIPKTLLSEAVLVSHSQGILAGAQELAWLAKQLNLDLKVSLIDGVKIHPEQIIARLQGNARTLLAAERTILNVLQRMSGIATTTKAIVQLVKSKVIVCATRKTLLPPLDKRAVAIGGGYTHRLGLYDGVLVKDNHLALLSKFSELKNIYFSKHYSREIEISTLGQLQKFLELKLDYDVIMFDNFSPIKIKRALTILKQSGQSQRYLLEASGGITETNIKQYANSGIDAVSLGSLTHSVRALDLSLEIYRDGTK